MTSERPGSLGQRAGVAAPTVALLLETMAKHGVDVAVVRTRLGIEPRSLDAGRVPASLMQRVWEEAVAQSSDPFLGLRVAVDLRPEMFDAVGYCVKLGATLGDVVERMARYARVINDRYLWSLEVGDRLATLALPHAPGPPFQPQYAECILAGIGLMGRRITGEHLVATEVWLTHAEPRHAKALSDLFEAPICFSKEVCALVFDARYLSLAIPGHDATLCAILEREVERMLEELPRQDSFVARVQNTISNALARGDVTASEVAQRLAVSETTLRRRLREAEMTYQGLLDDVRFRLAQRYLRQTDMDVAEVAFSLGFSDPSSFGRAFKRWSGRTALEFRRSKA